MCGIELRSRSNNNIISGDTIINNNRGIYLSGSCNNNMIIENTIINNDCEGILLYGSSNSIIRNTITGNSKDGIYLRHSSNNIISENNITNNDWAGISLWFLGSFNNHIRRNLITDNGVGIYLSGFSNNNTISDNTITNNDEDGIELNPALNNVITGNYVTNNGGYGIILWHSSKNIIKEDTISSNFMEGIALKDSSKNMVFYCTIRNHTLSAVYLEGGDSYENIIEDCLIKQNWRGIVIDSYSTSNKIANCLIDGNYWGIKLTNSRLNTIEQCTFADNTVGIMRGKNNFIRRNDFIDNKILDAFGDRLKHKNFWFRNYYSSHNSPLPCYLFGLNADWFPRATPYDYPTDYDVLEDYPDNILWDWDDSTLIERPGELEEHHNFIDWDEYELSHRLNTRDYLMDLRGEIP